MAYKRMVFHVDLSALKFVNVKSCSGTEALYLVAITDAAVIGSMLSSLYAGLIIESTTPVCVFISRRFKSGYLSWRGVQVTAQERCLESDWCAR